MKIIFWMLLVTTTLNTLKHKMTHKHTQKIVYISGNDLQKELQKDLQRRLIQIDHRIKLKQKEELQKAKIREERRIKGNILRI